MANPEYQGAYEGTPDHLPAGATQLADGEWYYPNQNGDYVRWDGQGAMEAEPSRELTLRPVDGEISINISAKGEGLNTLERTLGRLGGSLSNSGRGMPHEFMYIDEPYSGDPSQNPAYLRYLESTHENSLLELTEATPKDLDTSPSDIDEGTSEDEDINDQTEAFDVLTPSAETSGSTVERRGMKRLRNLGIIAVVVAIGAGYVSHADEAGALAKEICSPKGSNGAFEVLGNMGCYFGAPLGEYILDISNANPWSE